MHKYLILALGLTVAACDDKSSETGDTATTTTGDTDDTNTGGGAPEILGWTGECTDTETFVGELNVSGDTNGTHVLNIWETGAPDASAWNEEHTMMGDSITLTQVDSPADVADNGNTLFGCGADEQFGLDDTTLTYAVRVYDTDGNFADCIQFGHEPETVSGAEYTTAGGAPSNPDELTSCRTM